MTQVSMGKRRARINREQILETAVNLLQEQGVEGVSIRKIANQIPCAPPSIYYYFENKEAILDALVSGPLDELIDRMGQTLEAAGTPRALLAAYASFWLQHRQPMSLLFMPGHWGQQSIFQNPKYQTVERMLVQALDGDEIRAEGYLGLVNGLLFKVQNSKLPEEKVEERVEQTLNSIV